MNSDQKSVLIVVRHSPYGSSRARAALDVALATAAFEQPVTLLFSGPGVLTLQDQQRGEALGRKTLEKILGSLPLYDIEQVFAEAEAVREQRVDVDRAPVTVTALESRELRALYDRHHHVVCI